MLYGTSPTSTRCATLALRTLLHRSARRGTAEWDDGPPALLKSEELSVVFVFIVAKWEEWSNVGRWKALIADYILCTS